MDIDVTFDFRRDTPPGKDPDTYSKTLRRYHKLLWSKELPCGSLFELNDTVPRHYLYHQSNLGEFSLSSDAVIPTFRWHKRVKLFIPERELEAFNAVGYTIGGIMVFPGKQIDGKWTINQARGCTGQIGDRFDLTLECVRRHYNGDKNPLSSVLTRYSDFFDLFGSFRGYVDFFLLNDLVSDNFSSVKISAPFDDFKGSLIPNDVDEYKAYEHDARRFIEARNQRIVNSTSSIT